MIVACVPGLEGLGASTSYFQQVPIFPCVGSFSKPLRRVVISDFRPGAHTMLTSSAGAIALCALHEYFLCVASAGGIARQTALATLEALVHGS